MNNAEEQKGKRQEVDKLLKGLPKVQASADFEERLHRRIAETATDRPAGGWIKHVFGKRPIPALAYSLSTLVLVGIVSYYAFFRSGSVPTPEQLVPPQTDNTAVRKDSGIEPPAASGKTDETTSEAPHVTSPSTAPQTRPAKPLLRQKQGRENLRDESAVNEPAFERDATESGNVTREPKKEQPAPQTQAPIPPVTQAPQPPLQEFRSNAAAVQEPSQEHGAVVAEHLDVLIDGLARRLPADGLLPRRAVAIGLVALMYGGLTLARAVRGTELSDEILRACRALGAAAGGKEARS